MNIVLVEEPDRIASDVSGGDVFRVGGARARHVREVLGAGPGDVVRVGLVEGPLGEATVGTVTDDAIELACRFEPEPPPRPRTSLVLAIPRPKSLRRLLPEVAALGVDRMVLLRTWRVQKPYLTARILEPEHQRPLLLEGLMQARCTRLPEVRVEPLFKPYVEDRLAEEFADARRLVLHPGSDVALGAAALGAEERVVLAIGPEGGFLPYEVEQLGAAGFAPAALGGRTLRVETACVAALAVVGGLRRASRSP